MKDAVAYMRTCSIAASIYSVSNLTCPSMNQQNQSQTCLLQFISPTIDHYNLRRGFSQLTFFIVRFSGNFATGRSFIGTGTGVLGFVKVHLNEIRSQNPFWWNFSGSAWELFNVIR